MKKFRCFINKVKYRVFRRIIWDGHTWDSRPHSNIVFCIDCGTEEIIDY